jgi:thioredoxin-related protein
MDIRDQTLSHSKTNKHHDSQPTIYKGGMSVESKTEQLAEQYQTGSFPAVVLRLQHTFAQQSLLAITKL